jgi:tetratricopeptide (TPR) repeat protein
VAQGASRECDLTVTARQHDMCVGGQPSKEASAMNFFSKQSLSTVLVASFLAFPAFAVGDAPKSDAGATMTKEQQAEKDCKAKKGKVWDKKHLKCVDPQQGMLDDDSIYETGRDLAMMGRYDEAITILNYVSNPQDKRVLNYLGYSYRKSGQIDVGLKYYAQALAVDPNYVLVREYLGEALIMKGDVAGAKAQLIEIQTRCGVTCEPYVELKDALTKINAI